MSKSKAQRKFDKLLDDLCSNAIDLGFAYQDEEIKGHTISAEALDAAHQLVMLAINIIDPMANPRFVVKVKKVKK